MNQKSSKSPAGKSPEAKAKKLDWNVLNMITLIAEALKESKFEIPKNDKNKEALAKLKKYFHTRNGIQTMLVCYAVYSAFVEKCTIPFSLCAEYIGVNVLQLAGQNQHFLYLQDKRMIRYSQQQSLFELNEELINPILNNEELPQVPSVAFNYQEFVDRIDNLFEIRFRRDMTAAEFVLELQNFEEKNEKIPFVTRCKKIIEDSYIRFFFYECCSDQISGKSTNLYDVVLCLYIGNKRLSVINSFIEETNELLKTGLIEFESKSNPQEATVVLGDKGKKLFFGNDYERYSKVDDKLFIKPQDISPVKLFYSPENRHQVEELFRILSQKNYLQIRNRLKTGGLPAGICVLLYGTPGSGKTETVYQLARKTGRVIVPVDLAETKSCWFGESEKKIKKVFYDYRRVCEQMNRSKNGRTPILLFNECDGVFSQRKNVNMSNTAQTENSIQNIILEALEKFDGILLATTNLVENLDPAFERRFIYKIHFANPTLDAKQQIWQNKIPWLPKQAAKQLALDYDFSGGEIINIVKKCQMKEIISGVPPAIEDVFEYCNCEKLYNDNQRKIGFIQ